MSFVMRFNLATMVMLATSATSVHAYTKESPEVRAMVDKGVKFLEEKSREERLGGRCLIGLVFYKEGMPDHPRVAEAVKACQEAASNGEPGDVYSNGLAIIFLCELDANRYKNLIQFFLGAMNQRQKQHGGWGYNHRETGDTSQTQYGCLGAWEAFQKGIPISTGGLDGVARWLIATQDPSGGWGYQGAVAPGGQLVKQTEITCSMVSAAMGSLLICADLVGILQPGSAVEEENPLPSAVKISSGRSKGRPRLSGSTIDRAHLLAAVKRGNAWMDKNYVVSIEKYTSYYLYALERYKTLQAILEGDDDLEPEWYNNGVEHLMKTQDNDGSWTTGCGSECDTAFSILFLIRSMEGSYGSLGEGVALGGEFSFNDITKLKVRGGKLVVDQAKTEIGQLLSMLDDEKMNDLDALINDSEALVIGDVDETTSRRLKQMVRSGGAAARILAVRALARTGDFDHVPTLLYAFAHDDPRLVQEARDGLRFISRRFEGYGLKNKFTKAEQFEALDKWKKWYQSVRPDVPLVLE
ncbi:MAG: hypothetical protein ACR2NU_09305 [Aeoliella sp.]